MMYKLTFLVALIIMPFSILIAQKLISSEKICDYSLNELVDKDIRAKNGFDLYCIHYRTTDVKGELTTATGALMIPKNISSGKLSMVAYQHGTVYNRNNVASKCKGGDLPYAKYFAANGYLVVMTDYLGLGGNTLFHPYYHAESEATSTVDLIRAAKEFICQNDEIEFDDKIFLAGYSQGGHATLATHKYIEENKLYDEFNIIASAPGSGLYDLSKIAQIALSYEFPGQENIVYLILSYQSVYGNLFHDYSEYFISPYDSIIAEYASGDKDLWDLSTILPNKAVDYIKKDKIQSFLQDTLGTKDNLKKAFNYNIVTDWESTRPIIFFCCGNDKYSPYQLNISAANNMKNAGSSKIKIVNNGDEFNHSQCITPTINAMINWFDSLRNESVNIKKSL